MIECPTCSGTTVHDGETCSECDGRGRFLLTECPRDYIGPDITEAANIASLCDDGHLPFSGGLLDQSSWFLSFWQTLRSEEVRIDIERAEYMKHGRS